MDDLIFTLMKGGLLLEFVGEADHRMGPDPFPDVDRPDILQCPPAYEDSIVGLTLLEIDLPQPDLGPGIAGEELHDPEQDIGRRLQLLLLLQ